MLGVYGDPHGLTPNLDRLAREGIRFTSAFAHATMTVPSHASILTGEYPVHHLTLAELERNPDALIYLEKFAREAPPDVYAADIKTVNALVASVRQSLR